MRDKSVVSDVRQVQLAIELARLGARLQVLESETTLSRERLLKLYKEINGVSPPKGMLPFSTDWFMSWMPNIHASLFADIYHYLCGNTPARGIDALIRSYQLYLEHLQVHDLPCVLSLTRAWSMVRFLQARMLETTRCTRCSGHFLVHVMDLHHDYVCGLCRVPSRAGRTKQANLARTAGAQAPVPGTAPDRGLALQSALGRQRTSKAPAACLA